MRHWRPSVPLPSGHRHCLSVLLLQQGLLCFHTRKSRTSDLNFCQSFSVFLQIYCQCRDSVHTLPESTVFEIVAHFNRAIIQLFLFPTLASHQLEINGCIIFRICYQEKLNCQVFCFLLGGEECFIAFSYYR